MFTLQRVLMGGILAAVAFVAIAGAGWWFLVREDAQLATSAPAIPADLVRTPTAAAASAAAQAVTTSDGVTPATTSQTATTASDATAYTIISDRSEAAYFAGEQLASLPLPSNAKGSTTDITGTFYLTADGLDLDPTRSSTFTVNLTTLKSDKDMRDNRVQKDGLETTIYPTATFTATSVTGYDPSIAEGEEQTLQLTGTLDLHGVQKEVTWEVKAKRESNVMTALATLNFKYAEFNIEQLNVANFVSVDDNVTLQVQIVAQAS